MYKVSLVNCTNYLVMYTCIYTLFSDVIHGVAFHFIGEISHSSFWFLSPSVHPLI